MPKNIQPTAARIAEIAAQMRGVCVQIITPHEKQLAASDAMQEATTEMTATRISVAQEIAVLAASGAWTVGETQAAAKRAVSMGNGIANGEDRSAKTLATFVSEMRNVAHPKVRDAFADIVTACEDAWAAEDADIAQMIAAGGKKSDVPTPVRKWSSRKYHLIMNVARAYKDDDETLGMLLGGGTISADVVRELATFNDPDHDHEKVAKRLAGIIEQLNVVWSDFHHDDIKTVVDYLGELTADGLLAARRAWLDTQAQEAAPAPEPTPSADADGAGTPTNVTPFVDPTDALLNDLIPTGIAA